MDLLEDPTFKNKYQKHKLKVKRWENSFKEKYARKPNKDDIRAADDSIKESYKMYYKLKTQALEETLLDITFPDESRANITANTSGVADASWSSELDSTNPDISIAETSVKNSENIDPGISLADSSVPQIVTTVTTKSEETPNVEGVWGSHLNKDKKVEASSKVAKSNLTIGRSSSFQLSRKLFSSSNLTKRNPRKSLSMNKLKTAKSNLEESCSGEPSNIESIDGFDPNESNLFGDTLKVISQDLTKSAPQPTNAIDRLIKGFAPKTNHRVNYAWLERCTNEDKQQLPSEGVIYNPDRLSGTSDSGIDSINTSDTPTTVDVPVNTRLAEPDLTDSEDFICKSDSEEEYNGRRIVGGNERGNKRVRNSNDGSFIESHLSSLPLAKRQCLVRDNSNSIDVSITTEKAIPVANTRKIIIEETRPETRENVEVEEAEKEDAVATVNNGGRTRRQLKKTTTAKRTSARMRKKAGTKGVVKQTGKRVTRKKMPKKQEEEEEEENDDENGSDGAGSIDQVPGIGIYGIEAVEQLVPRFAMPENTSGNLVEDFSRSVDKSISSVEKVVANNRDDLAGSGSNQIVSAAREKLEKKIASGTVNENFVRINIKKKVFVRGKKNFSSSKYRKNQWKQRKKELSSGEGALDLADLAEKSGGACFKCGQTGHFANRCTASKSDSLLPIESVAEEASEFLTLEQVEKMAKEKAVAAHCSRINSLPKCPRSFENEGEAEEQSKTNDESVNFEGHKIPEDLLAKLGLSQGVKRAIGGSYDAATGPIYPLDPDGSTVETPDEVFEALKLFGHENFRAGQEKAIMRILSGQSTLVTLSTGSGKSLCYQLPAYLYSKRSRCVTLVISPLVSLMDDQVTGVPKFLSAAAFHTGQTPKVREQISQRIKDGELDILLVSPEAVVAGDKASGFNSLFRQLGSIAFACIDEAHCISQWSHNFRPSYLMLCRVLVEKLGIKTILGLTATATRATASSIVRHLSIHDGMDGVISDIPMPKNLTLTVSRDEQRDRALVELLLSPRFTECDSIIVYCTRREECTRIAGVLRVSLQNSRQGETAPKNSKCSPYAEAYHAGLTAARRKIVQKSFMTGQTRIVVATVAFGMGINKSDIRSVIHYNMPASFEGYVQEVGRAGRDNLPAHCHLFLSPLQDADKLELRRHIYANSVDRHTIRRLLGKIFLRCSCRNAGSSKEDRSDENSGENRRRCPGHEVAIPIDETVRALDISEETISTLLCYLELHPKRFVTVLSSVYARAVVSSYAGPAALKAAAQKSPPLAMAIALDSKKGICHDQSNLVEFPVVDVAAAIGWDSGVVKNHLKQLEWQTAEASTTAKRSAISVKFDTLGLRVRAPGDLTDAELDEALEALADRARSQEISALRQLETIHSSLEKYSLKNVQQCMRLDDDISSKSELLKQTIRQYFDSDAPTSGIESTPVSLPQEQGASNEAEITSDVRGLISSYRENNFTGRAVARIFYGIQSPNYSALTWSRCRFWRCHLKSDFNLICRIANREILAMR